MAEAHNNMANVLRQQGDLIGARTHLKLALLIRPDYSEAIDNLEAVKQAIKALDKISKHTGKSEKNQKQERK